jgi:PqqD family protein of HPr-rel-A system
MTPGHHDATVRWRVHGASGLCWRVWGEEHVVFQPASGDTHLLNPFTAEVLRALEECPASAAELTRLFAPAVGPADGPTLGQQIQDLLARFYDLGLIEPTPE